MNLIHADCLDAMAAMEAESIDAIVTDPPYGLEFMGKEWDRLDGGLPQENVWKGRRGKGGSNVGTDDSKPSSRHHVSYGGKHNQFKRCSTCGKRQFSGSPCVCPEPTWEIETAQAAPTSALRMQRWHEAWAREAYRIAKPGAHLLAFGGTRTVHRLAAAIEDAGWEIRDMLVWGYASGFPKSLDVSKAIDKAAGAEREIVAENKHADRYPNGPGGVGFHGGPGEYTQVGRIAEPLTAPATPDAEKWNGWGTALKPAWEPIVMARKPLRGTVAANVLRHGTGALNIDGTRIGLNGEKPPSGSGDTRTSHVYAQDVWTKTHEPTGNLTPEAGRWPANVILTDPIFDGGVEGVVGGGETTSGALREYTRTTSPPGYDLGMAKEGRASAIGWDSPSDSGTYSRFFTIPESSTLCEWCGVARSAEPSTSLDATPNASAPSPVPTEASSAATTPTASPTTSGTEQPSSHDGNGTTSRTELWPGSQPVEPSRSSPAKSAARNGTSSDTTTTTPGRWMCASCAEAATRFVMAERESAERNYPWAFLIPKSARSEREPVLGGPGTGERGYGNGRGIPVRVCNVCGDRTKPPGPNVEWPACRHDDWAWVDPKPIARANVHPTVKPLDLMRHLVRLVTPPGGCVLDPFLGSGTTALAAEMEGFAWVGIEKEAEYIAITEARLNGVQRGLGLVG